MMEEQAQGESELPQEQAPLLYTKHGNIPMDGLERRTLWSFDETGITFAEEWWQGADLVKRSADRFQYPPGTTLNLIQGGINAGSAAH